MKDLFIPYNLAKKAQKKGFNERCLACINSKGQIEIGNTSSLMKWISENPKDIFTPSYEQIENWLAKNHNIRFSISVGDDGYYSVKFMIKGINKKYPEEYQFSHQNEFYPEKNQSLNNAIEEALNYVK